MGSPDSPHVQGVNNAIVFLLGLTLSVLVGFAAFFVCLWWRARQYAAAVQQATELRPATVGRVGNNGQHLAAH
jgi:hypothetical protein